MFASVEFTKWCDEMEEEGKGDLVKLVKKECRAFCSVMVDSVKGRLQSIWNHIQALELIDPLGPELLRYTLTHPRSHPLTHPRSHPRTHAVTHAPTQHASGMLLPQFGMRSKIFVGAEELTSMPFSTTSRTLSVRLRQIWTSIQENSSALICVGTCVTDMMDSSLYFALVRRPNTTKCVMLCFQSR